MVRAISQTTEAAVSARPASASCGRWRWLGPRGSSRTKPGATPPASPCLAKVAAGYRAERMPRLEVPKPPLGGARRTRGYGGVASDSRPALNQFSV